jgi:serine phosphatase RsbU (regulator of sigma subunit)
MSIAAVYFDQKKYAEAEEFYLKSLAVSEEIKAVHEVSYCKKGLADVYWAKKEYEKAAKYGHEALLTAIALDDKVQIRDINEVLGKIYEAKGDDKKALFHFKVFKIYADTLVNLEIEKKTATLQLQHDFDKKTAVLQAEQEKQRNQLLWIIFSAVAGLLSVSVILLLIFRSRKKIALAYGKLSVANKDILQKNEEINQQKEEIQLTLELVNEQKDEIEKKNADIIASINYALRIQNAVIPKESELQKYLDCFVLFKPKDIVSGDFYWFAEKEIEEKSKRQNTNKFYILAVADCTGHGVSGAFMTMIGNNILNQIVHDWEIHEPNEILNKMQVILEKTLSQSEGKVADGMDIAVVKIEADKISYAGAMNPLYYTENCELKEIKADKKPIGGATNTNFSYTKHEISIRTFENQTTFYLCSDGYQDQFGGKENKKFMTKNLKKLLTEIAGLKAPEQKRILEAKFEEWKGDEKQTDDVCVLGFCFSRPLTAI